MNKKITGYSILFIIALGLFVIIACSIGFILALGVYVGSCIFYIIIGYAIDLTLED